MGDAERFVFCGYGHTYIYARRIGVYSRAHVQGVAIAVSQMLPGTYTRQLPVHGCETRRSEKEETPGRNRGGFSHRVNLTDSRKVRRVQWHARESLYSIKQERKDFRRGNGARMRNVVRAKSFSNRRMREIWDVTDVFCGVLHLKQY